MKRSVLDILRARAVSDLTDEEIRQRLDMLGRKTGYHWETMYSESEMKRVWRKTDAIFENRTKPCKETAMK